MQSFLQFLIIGLGAGATYALFAQGAVLIYRGSGLVNFAQGAVGTFAAYLAFVDLAGEGGWSTFGVQSSPPNMSSIGTSSADCSIAVMPSPVNSVMSASRIILSIA